MYCLDVAVQQRVHTVSRKSERLVNLTIALLGTKRWLTKAQIFSAVDGYEGESDAKERMFERDKDDLRNLGIEIEVGSFDPLFEDEAGYRIQVAGAVEESAKGSSSISAGMPLMLFITFTLLMLQLQKLVPYYMT